MRQIISEIVHVLSDYGTVYDIALFCHLVVNVFDCHYFHILLIAVGRFVIKATKSAHVLSVQNVRST